jgi:hypothetical protein
MPLGKGHLKEASKLKSTVGETATSILRYYNNQEAISNTKQFFSLGLHCTMEQQNLY